jgi:hypothetical protein
VFVLKINKNNYFKPTCAGGRAEQAVYFLARKYTAWFKVIIKKEKTQLKKFFLKQSDSIFSKENNLQ